MDPRISIENGKAILGIEFGSTRIKAVLVDGEHNPIAQGSHEWENQLENGLWTYSLDAIWSGLQDCYADLRKDVQMKYGVEITRLGAIGISAMMHGYMAFDAAGQLLVPFRTWRNTNTGPAAKELSELFQFNMPLRWSLSHLYQCILDDEPHVKDVDFFTTLAGYIHWKLTGRKVLGIGDASGMMPVDAGTKDFDKERIAAFDRLVAPKGYSWKLEDLLPQVLLAQSIEDNIVFTAMQVHGDFLKGPLRQKDSRGIRRHAEAMIKELDIRCTSPTQPVGTLSGGNQQKVCVARALTMKPKFLFVSEPTRGIDIGAKQLVLETLVKLNREQGMTIVMVSSELQELRSICDRIAIVAEGKVVDILRAEDSDTAFGLAMSGKRAKEGEMA